MKKEVLNYKGYTASLHFSLEDSVLYGKVEGIKDVITFEFEKLDEAQSKFEEAIEDYFEFCKETNSQPDVPEYEVEFFVTASDANSLEFGNRPEESDWSLTEYHVIEMEAAA